MLKDSFSKIDLFNKSLTGSWMKNEAILNNIANVNTPNYKRETVNFEDVLQRSMSSKTISMNTTNIKHMNLNDNLNPITSKDRDTSFRNDGNNVNIDVEMAELAENQIKYSALTTQLNATINRIKIAMG